MVLVGYFFLLNVMVRAGGIAYVLHSYDTNKTTEYSKGYYWTNNNRTELIAVIERLKSLTESCYVNLYQIVNLLNTALIN